MKKVDVAGPVVSAFFIFIARVCQFSARGRPSDQPPVALFQVFTRRLGDPSGEKGKGADTT